MFVSFVNLDGEVPWIDCDNPWNTKACRQEAYPDFKTMTNETQKVYELYSKCSIASEFEFRSLCMLLSNHTTSLLK